MKATGKKRPGQIVDEQNEAVEKHLGAIEQSAKFISPEVRGHWNAMHESGAIERIIGECRQHCSDDELRRQATFVLIRCAEAWGDALAYARDRIDDAF